MSDNTFPSFLSEGEIDEIHDIMGEGQRTVQLLQKPVEPLEFKRFHDLSESWAIVLSDVIPISIKYAQRQADGLDAKDEIRKPGTLRLWIDDFNANPLHIGDRFIWQGQTCVIELIGAKRFHHIDIDFVAINENLS